MKLALAATLALIALVAPQANACYGSEDPNFAYADQMALYDAAATPALAEVTALPWMLVGKASAPTKSHLADFYAADGRQPGQNNDGYYQEYLTINNVPEQTAQETYYGAETGKLYKTYDYTYTIDADATNVLEIGVNPKALESCRLVVASGMLLCKVTFNHPGKEAREGLYTGQAAMYLGYVAVAPAQ